MKPKHPVLHKFNIYWSKPPTLPTDQFMEVFYGQGSLGLANIYLGNTASLHLQTLLKR